jgi:hypothetical protein
MSIVFLNQDKKGRAEDIYLMLLGKRTRESYSSDHVEHCKTTFGEKLAEQEVDLKDKEASILAIYKLLAGATSTTEEVEKTKKTASKKKAKKVDVEDEDGDEGEDDEDEDE